MASFRKRIVDGQTRWDVTVTRLGAPRQSKTFQTKSAGEAWARDLERDAERGTYQSTEVALRVTVGRLVDRYYKDVLSHTKSALTWKTRVKRVKEGSLASLPLLTLTPEKVAAYRDQRLKTKAMGGGPDGKPQNRLMSTQSVRHELGMLKRAIDHASREWGLYLPAGNPVTKIKLPAPSKARERRSQGVEYERLLQEAYASRSPRLGYAIEFATETAMRRGEICNLQWSDIDLNRRIAHARETKNGEPRHVPLSNRAIEVLIKVKGKRNKGAVFGLTNHAFSQAFKRVARRIGSDDLRLHDLRHEATSRLAVKLNGDVLALSAITGHKTLQMLKRYTHLNPEDLAKRIA